MPVYDITLPLRADLAAWPGDTPYTLVSNARIAEGSSVNLSSLCMSVHMGTHVDAPYHYDDAGATAETLDLSVFIGPAVVVDVSGKALICVDDLRGVDLRAAPRVLFKTAGWTEHARFPERIPTLAPDMPAFLRAQGVVLVGFDVPSVDALDSKDMPIHHALGARRIAILESLLLTHVPPGVYELIALPLKLVGADGAPIRAVLRA